MTNRERAEAVIALKRWFESQDIMPPDGAMIMIELLAICLIDKTKDVAKLQESCEMFRMGLVMNVALMFRESYP